MAHCARFVFFAIALASLARAQNWCGTSFADAGKCAKTCPGGVDSECPGNERCFAGVSCTTTTTSAPNPPSTQQLWCGGSFADASKCAKTCPGGVDSECPGNERCFAAVTCATTTTTTTTPPDSTPQLWCGGSFADATKCATSCPGGVDAECPGNERCFADVPCTPTNTSPPSPPTGNTPQLWCGASFADAAKCSQQCPNGVDADCPGNERCFADVTCSTANTPPPGPPDTRRFWCGTSFADAGKCGKSCPNGVDADCPGQERCFADVACTPTTPTPRPSPASFFLLSCVVSRSQFNALFPTRNKLYTYKGFISAAATFPGFMTTGDFEVRRREAAAFFANIAHESCNLECTVELNTANYDNYCDARTATQNGFTATCDKNGRRFQYYGRGPIQLSWNFNYRAAGDALGLDLLHNPDLVATDSKTAWRTAIWFWMNSKGAGSFTPHNAITTGRGFGETIRSINGALECDGKEPAKVRSRVNNYLRFVKVLWTSVGPGKTEC